MPILDAGGGPRRILHAHDFATVDGIIDAARGLTMRSILQLFSLMYMALRRPLAMWYESQPIADAIAGAALFVAVCFNAAAVLYVFKQSVISTVFNGTPRGVLLVAGIVAALTFNHAMFGGGRAERLAGEGEKKWPFLATKGAVFAASYLISSALLMVIAAMLGRSNS